MSCYLILSYSLLFPYVLISTIYGLLLVPLLHCLYLYLHLYTTDVYPCHCTSYLLTATVTSLLTHPTHLLLTSHLSTVLLFCYSLCFLYYNLISPPSSFACFSHRLSLNSHLPSTVPTTPSLFTTFSSTEQSVLSFHTLAHLPTHPSQSVLLPSLLTLLCIDSTC